MAHTSVLRMWSPFHSHLMFDITPSKTDTLHLHNLQEKYLIYHKNTYDICIYWFYIVSCIQAHPYNNLQQLVRRTTNTWKHNKERIVQYVQLLKIIFKYWKIMLDHGDAKLCFLEWTMRLFLSQKTCLKDLTESLRSQKVDQVLFYK